MEDERSVSPWSVRADGCITGSMVSMVILSDSSVYLSRKFDSISLIESVSSNYSNGHICIQIFYQVTARI